VKIDNITYKRHTFNEGFILDAITHYIDYTNFPKNILFKKLCLIEDKLKREQEDMSKLIIQGSQSLTELISKSDNLNNRCNNLLYKLRIEFSKDDKK